jgi:general secretion pathway protein M
MIKAHWQQLTERDRWIAAFGLIVLGCYLYYLLLYAPLAQAVENKTQQIIEKQQTLAWMQQMQTQYKHKKTRQRLSSSQLLTLLADQLKQPSFLAFAYQLQQTGSNDIQLSFERVPYALFLAWLRDLNEKYQISLQQLTINRTPAAGIVKLSIVF